MLQSLFTSRHFIIFEQFLAEQDKGGLLLENTQIVETEIWQKLFEFQKDAVKGAINKINTHSGCIIADSVGLGKTFEALAIIKYFELRNHKVLVLCPKKVRENWTIYQAQNNSDLNPFVNDRLSYTVLCHTILAARAASQAMLTSRRLISGLRKIWVLIRYHFDYEAARIWRSRVLETSRHDLSVQRPFQVFGGATWAGSVPWHVVPDQAEARANSCAAVRSCRKPARRPRAASSGGDPYSNSSLCEREVPRHDAGEG